MSVPAVGVLHQTVQTVFRDQIHMVMVPGISVRVPLTLGVTQVRLWGISPGGPGGGGRTAGGGGGGGSSGEWVGRIAGGRPYVLPATTVAIDFYNGRLGTPGRANAASGTDGADAEDSTAHAVLADGSRQLLQRLRGGARGGSAIGVEGGRGADSPNHEMRGGAGGSNGTDQGDNGNYPGDIASYVEAGGVVPGASGGGGGYYAATRQGPASGWGGAGGAPDGVNGNVGRQARGDDGGADAGGGGNNPGGMIWMAGYNGTADAYSASGGSESVINTAYGSGGSGGPSGRAGRKGGPGCWRMQEVPGTNRPGAWQGAERLAAPRVFPAGFIRAVEPGWPGPAGGYGTQYAAPAYAGAIGGLRTFGWEDGAGRLANGEAVGAAGPWPSVMSDPANPRWDWYDERIAAATALGLKITQSFFGTPRVLSTNSAETSEFSGWPPANWQDLYDFVVLFLSRYGYGTIDRVEAWNEPAEGNFFHGTMSQLVDLHWTIRTAAKSVDPRFQVVSAGWIGSGDATRGIRTFMNASGAAFPGVKGYQTFDSFGTHPYETWPNDMAGNVATMGDAVFSSNKGCILHAWEEMLSLGGTWGGFDVTEVGFTNQLYGLANDGLRGLFIASHLLHLFALGCNAWSPFQIKSGLDSDGSGRRWFGPTAETLCAKVFGFFSRYIAGREIASIKEQTTGSSSVWRIRRSDGATFLVDDRTFA